MYIYIYPSKILSKKNLSTSFLNTDPSIDADVVEQQLDVKMSIKSMIRTAICLFRSYVDGAGDLIVI